MKCDREAVSPWLSRREGGGEPSAMVRGVRAPLEASQVFRAYEKEEEHSD